MMGGAGLTYEMWVMGNSRWGGDALKRNESREREGWGGARELYGGGEMRSTRLMSDEDVEVVLRGMGE